MNPYESVARVIRYLDAHHVEQPPLDVLAAQAGLSPSHFHRLFRSWAGATPKDFLQCLTAAHARALLRSGHSVLDAALDSGLSGPGRLHDLCVCLESATPGELKSGGAGWRMRAGFAPTPFGTCLLAESPRGLCHLSFPDSTRPQDAWAALKQEWPNAVWRRDDDFALAIGKTIFSRPGSNGAARNLRACVKASGFELRVWRALLRVRAGEVTSYGRLAAAAGSPGAARAAGSAAGRNALAYLIPCHRVIRETGIVGGYRWDPARKRAMLGWEQCVRIGD